MSTSLIWLVSIGIIMTWVCIAMYIHTIWRFEDRKD